MIISEPVNPQYSKFRTETPEADWLDAVVVIPEAYALAQSVGSWIGWSIVVALVVCFL